MDHFRDGETRKILRSDAIISTPFRKQKYRTIDYYDESIILLGTGLRISELYGLARADIDFEKRGTRMVSLK